MFLRSGMKKDRPSRPFPAHVDWSPALKISSKYQQGMANCSGLSKKTAAQYFACVGHFFIIWGKIAGCLQVSSNDPPCPELSRDIDGHVVDDPAINMQVAPEKPQEGKCPESRHWHEWPSPWGPYFMDKCRRIGQVGADAEVFDPKIFQFLLAKNLV